MNAYERFKFVLVYIVIVFGFILIGISLFQEDPSKKYLERGIKVEATITESTGLDSYHGVYTDASGNEVYAEILPNDFSASIGTVLEGYYLPEESDKVWCKPSDGLVLALNCLSWGVEILFGFCIVVGIWGFFRARKIQKEENQALWREGMEEYHQECKWNDANVWNDNGRGWQ